MEENAAKANVTFYEKKVSSRIKGQHDFSTAERKAVR